MYGVGPQLLSNLLRRQSGSFKALQFGVNQARVAFSTSNKCVSMSSEESFNLRHQLSSEKKTNKGWYTYRLASVGVLGACASCFIIPGNPIVDFAAVTLIVHHNHAGIKSVIADYAPLVFKDWIVQILYMIWLAVSVATLGLLYAFNYNNIGFSQSVVNFLKL
uniref:Succinate dehydrogenase [ubiquinone] cytochrome b small subunit n=1 Tax=Phallusia mammillata TaxID=59560 RepID=A0A6F9DS24_9ASCI|nr:putative succinate dehydrogenase [ubiquinone] cytochrome b small subunit, mitochondrial [Phallusia mammillata]